MRGSNKRRWRTNVAGAVLVLLCQGVPTIAQTQTFELNIPAQDLGQALRSVAQATRHQIAFESAAVRGKRAPALRGSYTARGAVEALLAGSDLTVAVGRSGLLIVRPAPASAPRARPEPDRGPAPDPEPVEVAEILVTGSRNHNLDIRRSEDDAQPYVVFDHEEIQASQATTVEEFLRTRMPQNAGFAGSLAQQTGTGRPYSSFNLRGLGPDETLILVDGRRLAHLNDQNSPPRQADVNGIPVGSIERIEILPSSASGIYGGNALGGVINIILRRDYSGVEVTTTYNDTFDNAAPSGRLDVSGGFTVEDGRTTVSFGGSLSEAQTLRIRDRVELIKDGLDLHRRAFSPYAGTGTPPEGNGVNIRSQTGANLVLDPALGGTNLGSSVTHLPVGGASQGAELAALLLANAGRFNLDLPDTLSGLDRGLLTSPELRSFNIGVRREFTTWLDVFADYSRFENRGTNYSGYLMPTSVDLAADAPTNPFQQAIRVSFPTSLSLPFESRSETETLALGSIVRLPRHWALSLGTNRTSSENTVVYYLWVIESAGLTCGLQASTAQECDGRPVLNPLQSPMDFGEYLFTEPTGRGPWGSSFTNPYLRASGPLFNLPGGRASLTLALQQETTDIHRVVNMGVNASTRAPIYAGLPERQQRITSAYGEVFLPLLSPANNIALIEDLDLRLAVRQDRYVTVSPAADAVVFPLSSPDDDLPPFETLTRRVDSTNYTLAARYSPVAGLVFRGSFATGLLPPNVVQLGSLTSVYRSGLSLPDPLRGGEAINHRIEYISGQGNPQLRPETSESLSAGVILTPVSGLRLSADWTRIEKTDEIGPVTPAYLLANPDLFPGRIVRQEPQPGDPAGFAGRIVSVDVSAVNMLRSEFAAWDFQADYSRHLGDWGRIRLYALATLQKDAVRQLAAGLPALNYAGNRDGPLEWQGNGGFDWERGPWRVRWNTQFYDSYNIYTTQDVSTATGAAAVALAIRRQGARRVPSQTYSDLHVTHEFDQGHRLLGRLRLAVGIQNVFNQKPPAIAIRSPIELGYSVYGDPRLRRFSISLTKSF